MKKNLLKLILIVPSMLLWQGANAQYCSGGPQYNFDTNVESVNITGDNTTSIAYTGCPGTLGVEDQTALSVDLTAGSIYTMDVEFGTCGGNYSGAGEAWIDFNQNNVFEPSESIGTSTGTPNSGTWSSAVTFSFTVPPTAVGGTTRIRVIQEESGILPLDPCASFFYGSVVDFTADITPVTPTCPFPSNLVVTGITSTGATLDWTENGTATMWNIEWGAQGFVPGTGNELVADNGNTTQTSVATGLNPASSYDVYVQADCGGGDLSFWIGPYSFSNSYCDFTISSISPQHITSFITTGAIVDINNPASGPGTPNPGYTDFTNISMEAYETQLIDFSLEGSLASTYGVDIYVDWNNNFTFDANEVLYTSGGYIGVPLTASFTIPPNTPVGQYRMRVIADYFNGSNNACSGNSAEAEDYTIEVIAAPSCLPPFDVDTVSTTTTSIELQWLELNGATAWSIEYGASGFTQGMGTYVSVPSNPYTVSGLAPSTNYDFYVKSQCSSTDSSAWRGPFSVYTACGIAVAPYYEGFNNATQPQCWENLSSLASVSVNNFWLFDDQGDYGAANNGRAAGEFAKVDGDFPYADSVYLTTPEIDISQLTSPYLGFEWFSNNTNNPGENNPLVIEISDGATWTILDTLMGDNDEWQFANYDLAAYSNNIIQVRFMVNKNVISGPAYYNDILLDEIRIDNCVIPGGVDGSFDVCRLDSTVNLNDNIITKPNGGGEWSFAQQPNFLTQDSIFNVSLLPAGSYDVAYVERIVCYDTTFATINVFPPSSAGVDGAVNVCKNEPIDLYGTLSGNVDLGGEWFDFTNTLLPNPQPKAQAIPGQYNYYYVADNGVCPADTAIVNVTVLDTCDFLAIGEELFTEISVFPNPATNQLNIVNPSNAESLKIEMLDMNGRIVLVENKGLNNASNATLVIDHLERGIYTLRVYNNEGQKTFKIVKQ